jgi:hypothetical protein
VVGAVRRAAFSGATSDDRASGAAIHASDAGTAIGPSHAAMAIMVSSEALRQEHGAFDFVVECGCIGHSVVAP